MLRSLIFVPLLTIGLAAPAMSQQKAEIPKEGKYDITSCWSGISNSIDFSKTHSANSYELMGTSRSNPPGGLLDMTSFRCVGSNVTVDGKSSGMSACKTGDKDGDKILSKFIIDGPKATSETLAGTGKYEGIVRTGMTEPIGPFPAVKPGTFQSCNHGTGTYKMK
jgi:hypothetical protein